MKVHIVGFPLISVNVKDFYWEENATDAGTPHPEHHESAEIGNSI